MLDALVRLFVRHGRGCYQCILQHARNIFGSIAHEVDQAGLVDRFESWRVAEGPVVDDKVGIASQAVEINGHAREASGGGAAGGAVKAFLTRTPTATRRSEMRHHPKNREQDQHRYSEDQ